MTLLYDAHPNKTILGIEPSVLWPDRRLYPIHAAQITRAPRDPRLIEVTKEAPNGDRASNSMRMHSSWNPSEPTRRGVATHNPWVSVGRGPPRDES